MSDAFRPQDYESKTVEASVYLPEELREKWKENAEELGMGFSEYVRVTVEAGQRGIDKWDFSRPSSGGKDAERAILDALRAADGAVDADALVAAVVDDVESDARSALDDLQDRNEVRYDAQDGGFVLTD